jgi:hypothetical protein
VMGDVVGKSCLETVVVLACRRRNLGMLTLAVAPCAMQRGKRPIGAGAGGQSAQKG